MPICLIFAYFATIFAYFESLTLQNANDDITMFQNNVTQISQICVTFIIRKHYIINLKA